MNPKDFEARNNLAATSLLLKLNVNKAYELAKALYTERPDHAVIASTYAFALHLRGSTREGLAVLQKLKPEALEEPSVALYYGVLLSASGQPAQARKYLDLAQPAKLLPEEKQLLESRPQGALSARFRRRSTSDGSRTIQGVPRRILPRRLVQRGARLIRR